MKKPTIAGSAPLPIEIKTGETYAWCSCGESSKQPFCDGSHRGSGFTPTVFVAQETKTAFFCNCKHSNNAPFCDGAHNKL